MAIASSNYSVSQLLFLGLVFHAVFILSVFDCYFTSPVVNGMQSYAVDKSSASRLVLIVADGLRADLLFNLNPFPGVDTTIETAAPFLRDIAEHRGSFGISHTRVPTESRPGHVAIIAGMYEDVSAVTKGWKTNPVDFDSVFNQSSHTYSFGSPDILPMFARGATPGKVQTWSYNEEDEDFTKDATALDFWVLDNFRALLRNATDNPILDAQLRSNKVIFFLHLLGLDTTGHAYRPHSAEYMRNIQVVDDIVRQVESLLNQFYKDDRTSYVLTADHGMSNIGNHGDGHPDNTRTPLIAWGAGIRGPLPDANPSSHDSLSKPWGLGHRFRRDLEQADIAALMSTILGTSWPINSVGILPDTDPAQPGYLKSDNEKVLAQASLVNAKVILEHYRIKHELKRNQSVFYSPFTSLEGHGNRTDIPLRATLLDKIEDAIRKNQFSEARKQSLHLIKLGLEGLRYLQTYDRFLLRVLATAAYTGWSAYSSLYIFCPLDGPQITGPNPAAELVTAFSIFIPIAFATIFAIQNSPWTFYLYVAFPCYFWHQFLVQILSAKKLTISVPYDKIAWYGAATIGALLSMVAGYTHRSLWTLGFILMGMIWPFTWPRETRSTHPWVVLFWVMSCSASAIFPSLPVVMEENISLITLGCIGMLALGVYGLLSTHPKAHWTMAKLSWRPFIFQIVLTLCALIVTADSSTKLKAKLGLSSVNQVVGWLCLVSGCLMPFSPSSQKFSSPQSKIIMYFAGFGVCFIILSVSVEGLFYVAYTVTLLTWIEVEAMLRYPDQRKLAASPNTYRFQADDLRIALFFLFFVQAGFFGTGNVASISSFYLEPVYRLVPVFHPFLMASLLILKIVAPYLILSVVFATLHARLSLPPFSLLLVALTLTDGMTLIFFYQVSDTGSWLEIGQSISFFCITSLLLLWSAGICAAGEYLMTDVLRSLRLKSD